MEAGLIIGRLSRDLLGRSEHALDRHRHGMVTGARSQLDRHADRLVHRSSSVRGAVRSQLDAHGHLLQARGRLVARSSLRSLDTGRTALDVRAQRLAGLPNQRLQVEEIRTVQWRRLLGAYDYRRQLERGYSVTRDASGRVVRSAAELPPGSRMVTRLADGDVASIVTEGGAVTTDSQQAQLADEGMP